MKPPISTRADLSDPATSAAGRGETEVFGSISILERARTFWQLGEWQRLAAFTHDQIAADRERGKLAALIALAHSQTDGPDAARAWGRQALQWGCSRQILARLLTAGAQTSLARAALSLGEEPAAEAHFRDAIAFVEPGAEAQLQAQSAMIRDLTRLGFLPEAQKLLNQQFSRIEPEAGAIDAKLEIIQSEMDILRQELTLALKRGQLHRDPEAEPSEPATEARAFSQLGQDLWALERSGHKRGGFFVEFGATDGVSLSNTYLLERDFDWQGICAEPNPQFFAQLRKNRRCIVSDACIGPQSGEVVEFICADVFGGISGYAFEDMHGSKRQAYAAQGNVLHIETVSLADFLAQQQAPRRIDYLSIDTEGSEFAILSSFPFEQWDIRLLSVEHNYTPQRAQIRALLEAKGYRWANESADSWDDWFEKIT